MHFFLLKNAFCQCLWLLAFRIYGGQWAAEYACGPEDRERAGTRPCSQLLSLGGKMRTEFHKETESKEFHRVIKNVRGRGPWSSEKIIKLTF